MTYGRDNIYDGSHLDGCKGTDIYAVEDSQASSSRGFPVNGIGGILVVDGVYYSESYGYPSTKYTRQVYSTRDGSGSYERMYDHVRQNWTGWTSIDHGVASTIIVVDYDHIITNPGSLLERSNKYYKKFFVMNCSISSESEFPKDWWGKVGYVFASVTEGYPYIYRFFFEDGSDGYATYNNGWTYKGAHGLVMHDTIQMVVDVDEGGYGLTPYFGTMELSSYSDYNIYSVTATDYKNYPAIVAYNPTTNTVSVSCKNVDLDPDIKTHYVTLYITYAAK